MKKLSETYKELGIAFSFPIRIKDAKGNETYYENSNDCWIKREYDTNGKVTYYEDSNDLWYKYEYGANGKVTYFENSNDLWYKYEYGANGKVTYFEDSNGFKVVEVDEIKYKLKAL